MKNIGVFVLKIIIASAAISWGIKAIGPRLPIPATNAAALAIVLLPAVAVSVFLGWKTGRSG